MSFDTLVYIGRFQPLHNSHLALIRQALALAPSLILVLGSAFRPRSVRNPFNVAEREAMIRASLGGDADRVRFVPMRDYYNGARWAEAVRQSVMAVVRPDEKLGLFGHVKDHSSRYLHDFPDWPLVHTDNVAGLNATDLRHQWFEANGDTQAIAAQLPDAVRNTLQAFGSSPAFAGLLAEYRYLQDYQRAWAKAPFPPVFVTVDTLVRCGDKVLLIQRGGQPGKGCWALPGGFLDQHERVAAAALRELREETGLTLADTELQASLQSQALFDHPERSLRGRTLTHAYYYALPQAELPAMQAADDASAARWVAIDQLAGMEDQLFEDHFIILDHFLKLIDPNRPSPG